MGLSGQFLVANIADILVPSKSIKSIPGWSIPREQSNFYAFFVFALCVATGISVTALLWSRRPGYKIRLTLYILLLAGLLPISVFNYAHFDYLINRSAQALFNVFLVFGGTVVVSELLLFRSSARDLLVLQIISLTAVFLPAAFSVVWLLNALGVLTATEADSIGLPTLSTVSGVLSAAVAYMKFKREAKGEEKPSLVVSR